MLLRDTDTPMLRDGDHSYFNADSGTSIVPFLGEYEPRLEAARKAHAYFDLITCNHDTMRLVPRLTTRELALAYSTIFLMPGVPFIYYGDEIGMRYRNLPGKEGGYTRTGSRTPMQWDNSANHGFSQAAADALYLPVDEREDAPTVAAASPTATRSGTICTRPSNSAGAPRPLRRMRTSACCSPRKAGAPSCSSARKTALRHCGGQSGARRRDRDATG